MFKALDAASLKGEVGDGVIGATVEVAGGEGEEPVIPVRVLVVAIAEAVSVAFAAESDRDTLAVMEIDGFADALSDDEGVEVLAFVAVIVVLSVGDVLANTVSLGEIVGEVELSAAPFRARSSGNQKPRRRMAPHAPK